MRDFTINTYKELLIQIQKSDYRTQTFREFLTNPFEKSIILRHDVDLRPKNSLKFAQIQNKLGIKGVYYFRSVPESWDEQTIKEISRLGHEIGYHYECLSIHKGDFSKAIEQFEHDITRLRNICEVDTICMHGSPRSRYDSREMWSEFDYKDFNVIGEPYFDVDYNKVLYLTDTGRTWNNSNFSIRDRVQSELKYQFKNTFEIKESIKRGCLPEKIMINFHPQRWTDNKMEWIQELILQNIKNQVKRFLIKVS